MQKAKENKAAGSLDGTEPSRRRHPLAPGDPSFHRVVLKVVVTESLSGGWN